MGGESYFRSRFGIPEVINARGRSTPIGGSVMAPEVTEEMVKASRAFVELEKLQQKSSEIIARVTGAEAGYVTSGAAAGIAIGIAACITGTDRFKIEQLPDTEGMKNGVIVQKGHVIGFVRMARMTGAKIVEVGTVDGVLQAQIDGAINEKTAAILYIVSHLCVQRGMVPLQKVIEISKKRNIPVVVDAAAEFDLKKYIAMGADLVIYSGGKEIEGPSNTGFICGRKDLIKACAMQFGGIGRPMKVGREVLVALLVALERHAKRDFDAGLKEQKEKVQYMIDQLKDLPYVNVRSVKDETGRPIVRVQLTLDEQALGITASDLVNKLKEGEPPIWVRDEYKDLGIINLDPRTLLKSQEKVVVKRLKEILLTKK